VIADVAAAETEPLLDLVRVRDQRVVNGRRFFRIAGHPLDLLGCERRVEPFARFLEILQCLQ